MAFAALAAGVSGLQAFTDGVGVIADNITNVNTIGYKETRSTFSTLVTETSSSSSYSPGGVRASTQTLVSRQGLLQPTTSATDLAIDGAGFFAVRLGDSEDTGAETLFTRAGSFTENSEGFLQNTAGLTLLGFPVDPTGSITTTTNLDDLVPININNLNAFGQATSELGVRVNLQASVPVNAAYTLGAGPAFVPSGQLASSAVQADFETNVQIFDSLGGSHTVILAATRTGPNQFAYEYYFDDPSQLDAGVHGANGLIGGGILNFNTDGTIDLPNSTFNDILTGAPVSLPDGNLTFQYNSTDSLRADGNINFDFGTDGQADGFTQFDQPSTLISSVADGAAFDSVNGVSIGSNGDVTALFRNGLSLTVFRIPLVTFPNPEGLTRRQGNAFGISDVSGEAVPQTEQQGGAGAITSNALENSTVDLANEFAQLITVQRAFSASTRIITTSDEILQELTNI
jgi:flagellar hook protein FlgE